MAAKNPPIIVIKRKAAHAGHHGGAWKVAYADFVTAMMALFIVLWLMGSSQKVREAVAGYFNDPKGTASLTGTTMSGNGVEVTQNDQNTKRLEELKKKLEDEIMAKKELEELARQIEITITPEGLRIEMLEGKDGTFYQSGSARLSQNGQELLSLLAAELKTLPNNLLIEGHTDATQYSTNADYSNWELSADRANSARRLLQQGGVRSDQVTQVRGYADQMLRVKNDPYDPSNRRISILVKNTSDNAPPPSLAHASAVDGQLKVVPTPQTPPSSAPAASQPPSLSAASAPAKPSPAQPARPSLIGKLTSMLPIKKK